MKVVVTGGRSYANRELVYDVLDRLHGVVFLIHGGAPGADRLASDWADSRGVINVSFNVRPNAWTRFGRRAGPLRNEQMMVLKPDLVIAFPGGKGTRNCILQARRRNIQVVEITDDTN